MTPGQLILAIFLEIVIIGPIVVAVAWVVWSTREPNFEEMTDAELYYRAGVISRTEAERWLAGARPGITGEGREALYRRALKKRGRR